MTNQQGAPEALANFDAAVAAMLQCVGTVPCNSHEICTGFAANTRKRLAALLEAQQTAPSAAAAKQSAACDKAPAGWLCIRQHGHDSPCAAEPTLSARSDEWIEGYAAGVRDGRADALRAPQPSPTPQADSVLEDAARLDWLALAGPTSICLVIDRPHDGEVEVATDDVTGYGKTLREAIDAAMNKGGA